LARAAERTGKVDEALAAYTRIIDSRSDAWIFGSNDSLFLDDAWLAKGLLLEKLGRTKEAKSTLHDLIEARPTSRLRDDAERALKRMDA
jgi:tetratricopeptide (TPR) repeat protein